MDPMPPKKISSRRWRDICLIILFAASISAHLVDSLFLLDPAPVINEKRRLASWPDWREHPSTFPEQFEAYYQDHFGFRRSLILGHGYLKVCLLGVSPAADLIIGKKGWLFLSSDLEVRRVGPLLTLNDLERWQKGLERIQSELAADGIRYLLVVAPSPASVYPEFAPRWSEPPGGRTLLDRFLAHMHEHSTVPILDLRPAMHEWKARHRLYRRTDTHWNDHGAWVAYQEMIQLLRRWFDSMHEPWPLGRFAERVVTVDGGDLAGLAGLSGILNETIPRLEPQVRRTARTNQITYQRDGEPSLISMEIPGSTQPAAVMIHDSFTYVGLYPLLAEHFSHIDFYWRREKTVVPSTVRRGSGTRPDVVLEEIVERVLLFDRSMTRSAQQRTPFLPP